MKSKHVVNKENLGVGTFEVPKNAQKYILDVLKTKRISYGPYLKRFENEFAQLHGAQFGIVVNSGTSALRIAIACLKEAGKWKDGDEVIIPAVTFVSDVNILIQNNLTPVFVDVDPYTYNIDPHKIEEKIGPKTRAIIPSHLFGQPAAMDRIGKIARAHKLKVIEDSCETMFAKYRGKSVGSLGDIACFSTYVAHLIVTGVGGIALTNNKKYAEILRSLANHGRDGIYISIDDDKGKRGNELEKIVTRRFRFIRPGYSFRLTEFEGALGCAQLEVADTSFAARKKNAEYLIAHLAPLGTHIQLPSHPDHADHVFMMFPVVLKKGCGFSKVDLVNFLESEGIETRDMLPLINQPMIKKMFSIRKGQYPVADWINTNGFYIGCHPGMKKQELEYIVDRFTAFFSSRAKRKIARA